MLRRHAFKSTLSDKMHYIYMMVDASPLKVA